VSTLTLPDIFLSAKLVKLTVIETMKLNKSTASVNVVESIILIKYALLLLSKTEIISSIGTVIDQSQMNTIDIWLKELKSICHHLGQYFSQ
jgi:hypothetical protein